MDPSSLTINVRGHVPKYDEVRLVHRPPDNPVQPVLIVDEDALLGHTVCHHPDTQQEHEEEHVHHLDNRQTDKNHWLETH